VYTALLIPSHSCVRGSRRIMVGPTPETERPRLSRRQEGIPPVVWDSSKRQFVISLRGVTIDEKASSSEEGVDVLFRPPVLYAVHLRKVGGSDWGVGFVLPFTSLTLVDLEKDVEYEAKVTAFDHSTDKPLPGRDPYIVKLRKEDAIT
jgi:hypothetical protein